MYRRARNKVLSVEPREAANREENGEGTWNTYVHTYITNCRQYCFVLQMYFSRLRRSLLAAPPSKRCFAHAYTIPPATQAKGLITWRISARLLKQILLKSNCRLHGEGFTEPGAQFSPGYKSWPNGPEILKKAHGIATKFQPGLKFQPALKFAM